MQRQIDRAVGGPYRIPSIMAAVRIWLPALLSEQMLA
jgi:hypothetical protein